MAISVFLKPFTLRAQLPSSLSLCGSVFRNANYPRTSSLLSTQFRSLGSRAYCSKADHSPVVQNQTKSNLNLTKVAFKYVRTNEESQEDSRHNKAIIRKVLETPSGHIYFEFRNGDDVGYCNLNEFLQSYLMRGKVDLELASGQRVSGVSFVEASLFKERIRSIMDSAAEAFKVNCMIDNIGKTPTWKKCPLRLEMILDAVFDIRVWEIITEGDKQVLDIIVSELKKNGFDFTEDPVTLQKIEEAVEKGVTRMTNEIKLDLPVPAGEPEMSALISWGKYDGPPAFEICILIPTKIGFSLRDPLNCSCSK